MKFSQVLPTLATLTVLSTLAAAAPTEVDTSSFRVHQVPNGRRVRKHAVELAHIFRKYNLEPPEQVSAAALVQGQVTATPEEPGDVAYICPVTIGGQALRMDLDTGSSDLWVFSNELPASAKAGHNIYQCTKPKLAGETWQITYGDGTSAGGNIVKDSFTIGGVNSPAQAIECASHVSPRFVADKANDGILGLAFNNGNQATPNQVNTFLTNVRSKLNAPVFTAYLKHNAPGSYDFGYIDPAKYTGTIGYAPINTANSYWQFSPGGFAVGATSFPGAFSAIADTGTTLILTHPRIGNAYYNKVAGAQNNAQAGGIIFPCSSVLPSFSIIINGAKHTTPGTYINAGYVGNIGSTRYCYGGIQSAGSVPFTILGDTFLKSQLAVFDLSVPRVGFAQQK